MNRILVILMAAAVSFGLISCSGGGNSSSDGSGVKHTVTWNYNYPGAVPETESVLSGSLLTKHKMETDREGSYFSGKWYKESSCKNEWNFEEDKVTCDTVLFAKWKYKPYIVFKSTESFSLKVKNPGWTTGTGTIDYSKDTVSWNNNWDGTSVSAEQSSGNGYYYLYVRGKDNKKITGNELCFWTITPEGSSSVECYGSVMTLLDYTNPDSVTLVDGEEENEGCFEYLFRGCSCLTLPPELPAETLSSFCYMCMFADCTGLTVAPVLPAGKLAKGCYSSIFSGCTELTVAPELPITELSDSCYSGMFLGCEKLEKAPKLPATTLTDHCYNNMFYECTALKTAPELPAAELCSFCYAGMFFGCSSLNISEESGTNRIFTVPAYDSSAVEYPVEVMFYGTAGSFYTEDNEGSPAVNKTYYWN